MANPKYCSDCGEPLLPGATKCGCGWKSTEARQAWCTECEGQVKALVGSRCDFHYRQYQQRTNREDARDIGLRQAWKKTGISTKGKSPAEVAAECRTYLSRHGFLDNLPGPIRRAALEGAEKSEMDVYHDLATEASDVHEEMEGAG